MLVIGHNSKENAAHSKQINCDLDIDSPRKVHDMLKKAAGGIDFTYIICVEDDTVVASFHDEEDYDLSETAEDDQSSASLDDEDDSENDDDLHEDDEEDFEDE